EAPEKRHPKVRVSPRLAAAAGMKEPRPRKHTESRFHRARPVDRGGTRIGRDPMLDQPTRSGRPAFVSSQPPCLTTGDNPLQARQLPWELHVAWAARIHVIDVSKVLRRPAEPGFIVLVPIDVIAEAKGTGTEEVNLVRERAVRRVDDARAVP